MRQRFSLIAAVASFLALAPQVNAEPEAGALEVQVSFRERIALPPDAQLDLQLLDVSSVNAGPRRVASQRFAIAGVPMTARLSYDPAVIDDGARYAVHAAIWSDGRRMFLTPRQYEAFAEGPVDITLTMAQPGAEHAAQGAAVSGIQWAVTEVDGAAWSIDEVATFATDEAGAFAVFGGCNRFTGTIVFTDSGFMFPRDMAATMMACPDEIENAERRLVEALARVSGLARTDAGLTMTGPDGATLVRLEERFD